METGDACGTCGAEDWRVEELGLAHRFWWRLRTGRPAPRNARICGRCGARSFGSSSALYEATPVQTSWWGAPVRVWRALLGARTAYPAPIVYVGAAAVGIVVGVLLDLALGWPWWAVAVAFVVLVWLVFLATAFVRHPGKVPLSTELLNALSPKGRFDRMHRRDEEAFRSAPFPLYGLPATREGPRFLGSVGWRGDVGDDELELGHGDPSDPGALELRVTSSVTRESGAASDQEFLRSHARHLWREIQRPPKDLPPERFHEWVLAREREHRERGEPPIATLDVRVSGEPVRFSCVLEEAAWVGIGHLSAVTLRLWARNLEPGSFELERIVDVEPYIEGSRRLLRLESDEGR